MLDELKPVQEAIEAGHMELARNLLRVLIEDHPENAEVWYWAARAAINDAQRKAFLQKAVTFDPLHHQAANALRDLEAGQPMDASAVAASPTVSPSPDERSQEKTPYASFVKRGAATIIDFVIVTVAASPVVAIFLAVAAPELVANFESVLNDARVFAVLIALTNVIQGVYYGYFLSQQNGQTLGKRLLKIRVIKRDGTAISVWEAILRNVIGYQLSNLVPGVGFLWMFNDQDRRTWHDFVVDTVVVDA